MTRRDKGDELPLGNMTLLDRIDSTWTPAHEQMAATWAAALENNLPRITAAACLLKCAAIPFC
jgi:hypothetical protein